MLISLDEPSLITKTALGTIFPPTPPDPVSPFEESYLTGEALGALGMIYGIFNINPKRFKVYPDFENKVFKGDIIFKGHIYLGVVIIYCLKFYFNENIKRIIKKFI